MFLYGMPSKYLKAVPFYLAIGNKPAFRFRILFTRSSVILSMHSDMSDSGQGANLSFPLFHGSNPEI